MDRKDAIEGKKLEIGDRLDDAVRYLQECKEKGQNVYVLFSGYTLYSCDVTIDSAYMQVIGLTKAESEAMEEEMNQAITRDEEDVIIEKWEKVKEGHREEKKKIAKEVTLDEFWGDLDETVRYLQECNKRGENKYVEFRGNILYSCNVTIDSAYMQVIGLTKAESDAMGEEMNQAITRDEEDAIIEKWEKVKVGHREEKKKRAEEATLDEFWGDLDETVRYLQECNKRGENKYVEFKGNILYSCDVTIDSAYMQVIGLTKAESDAMEEEMNQAITRDEEDVIIEKWEKIKEGHREEKDKSVTKTILDSAIEATEESTRAGVIKRQAQTIISENKGRDNNIEMEIVE